MVKDWNPSERSKRLRNYRLFLRMSGPMLVLGAIMILAGATRVAEQGSAVVLVLGLALAGSAALNIVQVLRSTMHIVELDEYDARPAQNHWGSDSRADT